MTTVKESAAAIHAAALAAGKKPAVHLRECLEAWKLDPDTALRLIDAVNAMPEPVVPRDIASARSHADTIAKQRDAADLDAWRAFKAAKADNPVLAAALMNSNTVSINRGRDLDPDPTPPPKAAA